MVSRTVNTYAWLGLRDVYLAKHISFKPTLTCIHIQLVYVECVVSSHSISLIV